MKPLFIVHLIGLIIFSTVLSVSGQSLKVKPISSTTITVKPATTKSTSYVPIVKSPTMGQHFNLDVKTPKTKEQCLKNSVQTSSSATYKAEEHQVYSTSKGKLFIVVPNKTNTGYYRKYIPQ